MQGHTQSSESIWTAFNNLTTAAARQLKWQLKISWKRAVGSTGFATIGTSIIGGLDLVQGLDSVVTETDKFQYFDETSHLIRFEWDRVLQEPLGGMAICLGNVLLENVDGRFTPDKNATIGTAILPNRPLQMFIGFIVGSLEKVVPIFKGLTRQPREHKPDSTSEIECYDYVKFLNEYALESTIYTNQRSDQIITDILTTIGFGTAQYVLDTGLNTIGFAWFEKGQTAGERIKKICEAEEAFFYQDEGGILRFENRRHYAASPHNVSVWDIEPDDIIRWEMDESTEIINRVIIKADPKEVGTAGTEIWKDPIEEVIDRGETLTVWAQFDNPASVLIAPVATTDYTAFTATAGGGTDITTDISIVATLFTKSVKLEITNNNINKAYINLLKLRGTPIVSSGAITYQFEDTTSTGKYGNFQLEIENDFIDNSTFARYLAQAIVRKYKTPNKRIILTIQGIPQLQLRDKVNVKDPKTNAYTTYRVMRIQGNLDGGLLTQILTLRKVVLGEADSWAIVGQTAIGAESEFVGI